MSKKNVSEDPIVNTTSGAPESAAVPTEKMSEEDRLALELAKSRRETALATAKEALAKSETADLNYRYVVLQLYMKNGLSAQDALSEDGTIVRGGAAAAMAQNTPAK